MQKHEKKPLMHGDVKSLQSLMLAPWAGRGSLLRATAHTIRDSVHGDALKLYLFPYCI